MPAVQPELGEAVAAAEAELEEADFLGRLRASDPSLWRGDQAAIRDRLGWLPVVATMRPQAVELNEWAAELSGTLPHSVLLGMGGSSLGPEVLRQTFDSDRPDVTDTTYPAAVRASEHSRRPVPGRRPSRAARSRRAPTRPTSGSARGGDPSRFAVVTDPGTDLERTARERGYRRVFQNPADIGGRYSVLSYFGLVAAALAGIDVAALLGTIKSDEHGRGDLRRRRARGGARRPRPQGPQQGHDRGRGPLCELRPVGRAAAGRVDRQGGHGPRARRRRGARRARRLRRRPRVRAPAQRRLPRPARCTAWPRPATRC